MGSSSSSGQGTSESSSYIPDYPQSGLLQAISQYAFDHANDTYDWGMEQYNKNQGNIDNLMRNALSYASPQRISVDMGMAESGVQQGAEAGRLNAIRDLESYGIDPSSGRYAALDSANRVMASASAAGAGNQQRMADEAAGNVMRNQALAASLQNTSLGYQAADARNKMLATASSLKYPPLGTKSSSQHTQESQSVTDSGGGGGGGKSPQEKPSGDKEGAAPGGGGQPQPSAGRPSQPKPQQQQDKPPKKPGEEEEQQTPGNPLGDPFAPDSGSLAAPGAGPFQSAYDPTNAGLGDQNDIASRSGVDAAGNILGEMPTTEGGWPTYGSDFASGQQQDWGYNPSDLGNFDYLNQGDYQANQYDTFGSEMPSMDEFQAPINGDYENAAPYNVAGGDDSSWQVPGQDWYDQQGQDFSDQSYADQFSQDYGTDGYDNYGDYGGGDTGDTGDTGDYGDTGGYDFGDTSDYGDFGDFADGDYGDYGGDSGDSGDYGDFGDESSFDDFADASAADESNFDDSNYDDSSADDWSDTSSDDYDYGGGGDSGESDYARGGQVRKRQGMMAQGQRPPRRGPPGGPPPRRGPPPTGYRPGGPPPRPQMMGQRDRPPAPPPTVTARAAAPMPPPLPPRTGYMGPSGQPQGAPPTMMPPQRPPPLGMARGGNIRQQRGGVDPTSGGFVSRSLSPSGGNRTDDVNARLNAGEFVIPKDVAHWKGKEFFHKLIQQARKQHGGGGNGGGAPPTGYGRRQ